MTSIVAAHETSRAGPGVGERSRWTTLMDKMRELPFTMVTSDSRLVKPGALFVAVAGLRVDGHDFIDEAVRRGCAAVVLEKGRRPPRSGGPAWIPVPDSRRALGLLAAAFWQRPAEQLTMIGITGTNGKTTTAYLVEALIRAAGGRPGVIGTVNYRYADQVLPASHTTPAPEELHRLLRRMADQGVTHVVMEVSSHALAQQRLAGVRFDVALFTNLSRDHLDFHPDLEDYYASKKRLFFEHLKPAGRAVVLDWETDAGNWGGRLARELSPAVPAGRLIRCGPGGDVSVLDHHQDPDGTEAVLESPAGRLAFRSSLVGAFNLQNLVAAAGVGVALGYGPEMIGQGIGTARPAPGRLEPVPFRKGVRVYVDYAHTPDALSQVLTGVRELAAGRLIVVFGCGGDRDPGKRELMGEVAARLADVVVLTSDNPRSEPPERILAQIERGLLARRARRQPLPVLLRRRQARGYDLIVSRKKAIQEVLRHAGPGDLVLVCGKGHEDYQLVGGKRLFFDDRQLVREQAAVLW